MSDTKPTITPFVIQQKLDKHNGEPLSTKDSSFYRSIVDGLQYLSWPRPDLSFVINQVCQFLHCPRITHLQVVKQILHFVKGTTLHGLFYTKGSRTISVYCDADQEGSPSDHRSTTEFCIFHGSNQIIWSSKKQHIVARSSTEAEYRSLAYTAVNLTWLCHLFNDLHQAILSTLVISKDNLSVISLSLNPIFHARTKHIEIDYHYDRELVTRRHLQLNYIHTMDQLVYILTKPLSISKFKNLQHKLSVKPPQLEGVSHIISIKESQLL